MGMRDIKKKRKTKPVSRKQLGTDSEVLLKKELLQAFNLLTAVAKLFEQERKIEKLEDTEKTGIHIKTHAMMAKTVEAKTSEAKASEAKAVEAEKTEAEKKSEATMTDEERDRYETPEATLPKHLGRAIIAAKTWDQRDLLCRRFSAWCYEWSKFFLNHGDYKNAGKWVALSQRFIKISMDPKRQISEAELQRLQDMLDEIKERDKEERQDA
jgi:hypothetical protein